MTASIESGEDKNLSIATFDDRSFIYNSFKCPCGQCGIEELSECTCEHPRGAKEVKKFIDLQIASNENTVDQIIDKVEQLYGGKK